MLLVDDSIGFGNAYAGPGSYLAPTLRLRGLAGVLLGSALTRKLHSMIRLQVALLLSKPEPVVCHCYDERTTHGVAVL